MFIHSFCSRIWKAKCLIKVQELKKKRKRTMYVHWRESKAASRVQTWIQNVYAYHPIRYEMQTNRIKSSSADRNYSIYYWLMKDLLKSKIFNMVSILFLVARLKTQSNRFFMMNQQQQTNIEDYGVDRHSISFFLSLIVWKVICDGK